MAESRAKRTRSRPYVHVDRVEVFLWGRQIGAVALDPRYHYYAFAYTQQFKSQAIEPAPLRMPTGGEEVYLFTDLPELTYKRLPAMLSDALPDDFGNALINKYMAEQGIAADQVTPLDRLAYMSNRAMGALQFRPSRGPATRTATAIELNDLVLQARKALTGRLDDEDGKNAALRGIIDVGTSAGGARAKAVIALNPKTQEIRSGQVDVPDGFEHWLLKFDGMGKDQELGTSQHYGRIEYAYHLMARKAGIDMMECRLLEEHGRAHFMTRRFDRDPGNLRHHVQTLCSMDHLDYKLKSANAYAQLFTVIKRLELPYETMEQAFRRMTFNAMGKNCDDHTKNTSFRLRQGKPWELAPAYDITFAHNPQGEWTHQHLMSINAKFQDIRRSDLLAEAARFGIGTAPVVIDQVNAAVSDWGRCAEKAGLPAAQTDHIARLHQLM